MPFPNTDWPGSLDSTEDRTDYVDTVWAGDFDYQDEQIRRIQAWIGSTGQMLGEGIAGAGPAGALSPVADGGTAFQIAARNDFTSGKLLSVGDDFDSSYVEKFNVEFDGTVGLAPQDPLPSAGTQGRVAYKSGTGEGLYLDNGSAWNQAGGADADAIHDNVAGEIAAITAKGTPTTSDYLVIEDAADSNNKKSITLGDLPGGSGTDADAIHDNVAGEIAAVTEKGTPVSGDLILIEDSADSNNKKRVQVGNLPAGSGTDNDAIHDNVAGEISLITAKATPVSADIIVIEDSAAGYAKKAVAIGNLPAADIRTAGIIIGNSANGDTAADCDVLDAGDGTALKSTIEGASAGDDIFVRSGTYDLGSGPQTRITVPGQVRVTGAGRYQTHVKAWTGADGRALSIGLLSEVKDLYIEAPAPTAQTTAGAVIEVGSNSCWLKNIRVFFTGTWPAAANVAITAGLSASGASSLRMNDCWFWGMPDGTSGEAQVSGMDISTAHAWITGLRTWKGYDAFKSSGSYVYLDRFDLQNFSHNGIYHSGSSVQGLRTSFAHGLLRGRAYVGITHDGIVVYTAAGDALGVNISDVYMMDSVLGSAGVLGYGVSLQNVDRCVVSNCRIFDYGADGSRLGAIHLDANADNNVVALNTLGGNTLVDLGTNNDCAHNL